MEGEREREEEGEARRREDAVREHTCLPSKPRIHQN